MNILIDIGHPAHVHLFKHFANEMLRKGHKILFTCREKEFEIYLLKHYGFNYKSFGKKYSSLPGKLWGLVEFDFKEILTGKRFKPDLFLSHGSIYAAHASLLLGKPHISFEDTFNFEQLRLYTPFTKVILTSEYDHPLKSVKVIKYAGYHELAYLHPKRFTPDKSVLNDLGVKEHEKYVIIRFISWKASHDKGHNGITWENKLNIIKSFGKYARIFITSETELPNELRNYQIKLLPHRIHDAIAFAWLLFGESSTMAEVAAMLGIPSVFLYNNSTYYTKHLESKYNLMYNYSESNEDQIKAIQKGVEMLKMPNLRADWQLRRQQMLADKIDVTAFLVWFIENYPESFRIMKEDPEYQERFR